MQVGALGILYAPGSPLTKTKRPSRVVVLALHWCLFKLMVMSGVVKLQSRTHSLPALMLPSRPNAAGAGCPTWWGLTALHYHYATQCIPTPWAWLAHQMPNFIQKLSVASTFLIEVLRSLPLFLIAVLRSPSCAVRWHERRIRVRRLNEPSGSQG